ncbi:MAG: 50S ribosomal protein L13 [Candidatus Paceibacterota bacterium]|jgi:large subunit ribosomal protein L13
MKEIHKIDAQDKAVGRVASQAAMLLMGKDKTTYQKHLAPSVRVQVVNASKTYIPLRKMIGKLFHHHTGHPGGHKPKTMAHIAATKGKSELIRKAIYGMLPKNKLRAVMLKNLTITE